ncbi:MAG: cytochrome c [Burkholderiaceae bacterium]|nr:cytochrome c [Sulfuritalea sp.]MCF8175893.1 cytochrome c [Burkholderiaceae bacterium]
MNILALPFLFLAGSAIAIAEPSPARQKELVHLVRQDCGSCHGMTLQGGLGPALLPATLAGKPVEGLVATIIGGRPGTPMPPWHRFLAEDEAQWIVMKLMAGFPQ